MITFLFGLALGAMFGFIAGLAFMAVAAANKTAEHLFEPPHIETREHRRLVHDGRTAR